MMQNLVDDDMKIEVVCISTHNIMVYSFQYTPYLYYTPPFYQLILVFFSQTPPQHPPLDPHPTDLNYSQVTHTIKTMHTTCAVLLTTLHALPISIYAQAPELRGGPQSSTDNTTLIILVTCCTVIPFFVIYIVLWVVNHLYARRIINYLR